MPTFETAEAVCFVEKREIWRSHGPANGWRRAMGRYVPPKLGATPVDKVGSAAVYEVLRPIALAGKRVTVQVAGAAITVVLEWARIMEAALADVVRNKAEAAYARSDLFEKRRALMESWSQYITANRNIVRSTVPN